ETEAVLTDSGFESTRSDVFTITGTDVSWAGITYFSRQRERDGLETLTIKFTSPPSAPALWEVKRDWKRTSETTISFQQMISSLIAKYGEPISRRDARSGSTLVWHIRGDGPRANSTHRQMHLSMRELLKYDEAERMRRSAVPESL
ncbi:MAG: hypothetical protein AAFY15_14525, partial [Cyanobacteria bacterium J06648_11]